MPSPHEVQQRIILKRIAHTVGRLNQELEELDCTLSHIREVEPQVNYVQEVLRRWTTAVETERRRHMPAGRDSQSS